MISPNYAPAIFSTPALPHVANRACFLVTILPIESFERCRQAALCWHVCIAAHSLDRFHGSSDTDKASIPLYLAYV